jgi:hypothetical protein
MIKIFAIPMFVGVADSVATLVHFKAKKQMWSGFDSKPSTLTASYLHLYTTLQQSKNSIGKKKTRHTVIWRFFGTLFRQWP